MSMLHVENLEVYYGAIHAIKGVSFDVEQGEIIALIGANGAGKTTILHTITGLVPAHSGSVTFNGVNLTKTPAHKIVSLGMAHVPEGGRIFQSLPFLRTLCSALTPEQTRQRSRTRFPPFSSVFHVLKSAVHRSQVLFRAVNSRCSQWAERSCPTRPSFSWTNRQWVFLRSMFRKFSISFSR